MTIAAVYVTQEGVVLGADSTVTVTISSSGETSVHFFNHTQKLLEVGTESTWGIVTWGLGSLDGISYRTLTAQLGDDLKANPTDDPDEVAQRWVSLFFPRYSATVNNSVEWTALSAKTAHDPAAPAAAGMRTKQEEDRFQALKGALYVGFCLAGYCEDAREPVAYEMSFNPTDTAARAPNRLNPTKWSFWGAPNMIERLIFGRDGRLHADLKKSGKWTGSDAELTALLDNYKLSHQLLPIRDAIDFVHSCMHSTIKALKFSNLPQICGGPIELAVITTDRKFRWVKHKSWDTAIHPGD